MEEDIDTRKINNSFLRDHSYATEGNASPAAFRCWGRVQVADRCASRAARRSVAEIPLALGLGLGQGLGLGSPGSRRGSAQPSGLRQASPAFSSRWTRRPAPRELKWPLGIRLLGRGSPPER